jgi:hypothetical protein
MTVRATSAAVFAIATLAALAAPALAAPRTFEAVNKTTGYPELVYKKYPTGTLLLHVGIRAGASQTLAVPEDTQVYVWIDRAGCSPWSELTPKTGHRIFTILPDCKIEVSESRPA